MILKKDLMVAILATFCLTAILLTAIPIRSAPTPGEYDPWIDTNDDGILNYEDLFNLASRYGTFGAPINKTDLLLQLQSKIDSLNASFLDLEARVNALEAPGSVTTDKIANGSITNVKLDDNAVPFDYITSTTQKNTDSGDWVDMPAYTWFRPFPLLPITVYMSVSVTVDRPSHLWIMFSTDAYSDGGMYLYARALVNDAGVSPSDYVLTREPTYWTSCACNFYYKANAAGTYTVKIQWKVDGGTGYVGSRSLAVIALPA